ncbi:syntaxin-112-like [Prunus yedoensis var. nudiflora]|uniref:Syntaxin-112-like n=1 Tax=Prunus yedoensis var. nudiflora TaxID=2094558 RepID=A0A314UEG2_PRUYE|nr:syntaxin-112-like [Prunus yedoensis var. nudiflora]
MRPLKDLQRSLTQLHQVFLDMAVMVEKQGEQMDDIHGGTNALFSALKLLTGLFQSRYMDKRMEVNDSSSKDLEGNAGHLGKKSEHHDGIDSGPDDSNTI